MTTTKTTKGPKNKQAAKWERAWDQKADELWAAGDKEGAARAAGNARVWRTRAQTAR
jgi:hypothetical protein